MNLQFLKKFKMKSSKPKVLITGSTSELDILAKGFSNKNYKVILNGRSRKTKPSIEKCK